MRKVEHHEHDTEQVSPQVCARAVWMALENEDQHDLCWQSVMSIAAKIGFAPRPQNDWIKKAAVDQPQTSSRLQRDGREDESAGGVLPALLSSSMPMPARSSIGGSAPRPMPGSFLRPWNRRFMTGGRKEGWNQFIAATGGRNTCPAATVNGR